MPGHAMGDPITAISARGKRLSPLSVPGLEPALSADGIVVCAETGTLFVKDRIYSRGAHASFTTTDRLVAIDGGTGRVLWAKEYDDNLSDISAIPSAIFAVSRSADTLLALSTTDGTILAESDVAAYPLIFSGKVAADPSTGLVIAKARIDTDGAYYAPEKCVVLFQWDGSTLVYKLRAAVNAPTKNFWFHENRRTTYTIVPRRPGVSRSHLVVSCTIVYDRAPNDLCDVVLNVDEEDAGEGGVPRAPQEQAHPATVAQASGGDIEAGGAARTLSVPGGTGCQGRQPLAAFISTMGGPLLLRRLLHEDLRLPQHSSCASSPAFCSSAVYWIRPGIPRRQTT